MIHGTIEFKCDKCGERFIGPNIEWMATSFSVPQQCPKCGSFHTMPAGSILFKSTYKKIWEQMDKDNSEK